MTIPLCPGVKINDSEYLLSQYADDSSLILDDNPKSLDQSLFMLYTFSECAGLRVNLDKTEAIWLGTRRGFKTDTGGFGKTVRH
jgi:hypothetical protein